MTRTAIFFALIVLIKIINHGVHHYVMYSVFLWFIYS
jgi:hypothetical protein